MGMPQLLPRYTVDDLKHFPEDGNRYELLDGMLLVTPQAAFPHQIVASRLAVRLAKAVGSHAHIVGPGAVQRPPLTELQPDVLVLSSGYSPMTEWAEIKDFWLAIEVLSPSSRVYDRDFKRDAYLALGVREVWIVDWRERVVEVTKTRGHFRRAKHQLRWRPPGLEPVALSLDEVFRDLTDIHYEDDV
jgi:Uma2 family endonuclease